jgi:5-methylcytosine-specific restriction endonuclease McrA
MSAFSYLYKTKRWQRLRAAHIHTQPLCVMCQAAGRLEPATVADHVKPHKGDMALFLDPANLQSLCAPHHSSAKQREEWLDMQANRVDLDGYPVDGSW